LAVRWCLDRVSVESEHRVDVGYGDANGGALVETQTPERAAFDQLVDVLARAVEQLSGMSDRYGQWGAVGHR
jgi:hypothetical protein